MSYHSFIVQRLCSLYVYKTFDLCGILCVGWSCFVDVESLAAGDFRQKEGDLGREKREFYTAGIGSTTIWLHYLCVRINVNHRNPGWCKECWWRKSLSVRIPTLPLAFMVRMPSQKIYISTICNVRMMLQRNAVVRIPCKVRRTPALCLSPGFISISALVVAS